MKRMGDNILFCFTQFASGAFQHIKDTVLSALNQEPTVDISPDTVGTLSLIMLAQAQEVFFLKATRGIFQFLACVFKGMLQLVPKN